MPTSDPRVIESACKSIIWNKPESVLDIGVGFGKWGVLAREYTDIWNRRFYKDEWKTLIHGIEIHEKYRNPVWEVYNMVVIGDAYETCKNVPPYDMTIMMDVLEHFEKQRGLELVDNIMKVTKRFLVSYCNSDQKDVRDNPHEDHISKWGPKDFEKYSGSVLAKADDWSWATYELWCK